jgi:hypothetical protein
MTDLQVLDLFPQALAHLEELEAYIFVSQQQQEAVERL